MKKWMYFFTLSLAVSCQQPGDPAIPEWEQLFNGKDLDDWVVKIRNHPAKDNWGNTFRVEDGLLKVRYDQYTSFNEQFGHLFYQKPFSYYLLAVEYRFVDQQLAGGPDWAFRNSGVMFHGQQPGTMALEQDFPISLEAQFLGGDGEKERSTNNLCTPGTHVVINDSLFTPHCISSSSATYHGEQWIRAEILVLGDSLIRHMVNGDTVLEYKTPQYDETDKWVQYAGFKNSAPIKSGTISLQSESHPIDFRKVEIVNLEKFKNDPIALQTMIKQLSRKQQKQDQSNKRTK